MFFQIVETPAKSNLPFANVLTEYHEFTKLFSGKFENGLPKYGLYNHEIPLKKETAPKFHQIYKLNKNQLQTLKKYLNKNLKKEYIQLLQSLAEYPIIFVPKKNGKLQLCVNYKQLNNITIKNRYLLSFNHKIQNKLQGA